MLDLRWRSVPGRQQILPWPVPLGRDPHPVDGEPLPDALLRFGGQSADGRRATNLDRYLFIPEDQQPDQPVLIEGAGIGAEGGPSGRGAYWDIECAVRPLPPPGPLAFICAWPGRGIPESRVEVDAGGILEAATRAVTFWSDDPFCIGDC